MKKLKNILAVFAVIFAVVASAFTLNSQTTLAAAGNMYVSPASKTIQKGGTFSVSVLYSGTAIYSVSSVLSYNASQLEYVSHNTSGSPFSTVVVNTHSGSQIRVDSASLGTPQTGLIMNVTFKATGSGATSLSLSGNANDGTSAVNPTVAGANISITVPSTPTPTPTPKPTAPAPVKKAAPKPTSSTGVQKVQNKTLATTKVNTSAGSTSCESVQSNVGFHSVTIKVTCNQPASVFLKYGTEDQLLSSTKATAFGKSHDITLSGVNVTPGKEVVYALVVKNEKGEVSESQVQSVVPNGYTVKILVKDSKDKPLTNSKVFLHSDVKAGETDEDGYVTFTNVQPGDHELEYKDGDKSFKASLAVEDNAVKSADGTETAEPQNLTVTFAGLTAPASPIASMLKVMLIAVLAGAAVFGLILFRKRQAIGSAGIDHLAYTGPAAHGPVTKAGDGPNSTVIQPTTHNSHDEAKGDK